MHLFWEANITHTFCVRSYLKFLHALLSQYMFVMRLFLSTRHPCKSASIFFWKTCNMCSLLESQVVKLKADLKKNLRGPLLGKHFDRCIFLYTFFFCISIKHIERWCNHQNKELVFDQQVKGTHVSKNIFYTYQLAGVPCRQEPFGKPTSAKRSPSRNMCTVCFWLFFASQRSIWKAFFGKICAFQKHVDVFFGFLQTTCILFFCPQKQRCITKTSIYNLLSLLKNLNGFWGHALSLDKQLQCNNSYVFFVFVWLSYFLSFIPVFWEKHLIVFLTAPQKWCDQIWSNTCFWSNLITDDFLFQGKDLFSSNVFSWWVRKILLLISRSCPWSLDGNFWGVNALLWNLFVAKKLRPRIWDLHVNFSDLRIWF